MTRALILLAALMLSGSAGQAKAAADIRDVDFGNFTFRIGGSRVAMSENSQAGACVKRRGRMPAGSMWNVVPENIAYGDLDGDGREEAMLPLYANMCGGTMIVGEGVLVYTLRGGRPTPLPEFDYIDEGCEKREGCGFKRSPIPLVQYDADRRRR